MALSKSQSQAVSQPWDTGSIDVIVDPITVLVLGAGGHPVADTHGCALGRRDEQRLPGGI